MHTSRPSGLTFPASKRILAMLLAAVLSMAVMVNSPMAFAQTRGLPNTTATYDDQNPASVPWSTAVKSNVATRYGALVLSLDAVERTGVAKTGSYDLWGSPVPLTIWDSAKPTIYRHNFTTLDRPIPFNASSSINTELGAWTYETQSTTFWVTWTPSPGYIGYAPPLPIQIDPTNPKGQPAPQYHYATTGLPGKTTNPLESSGALGETQKTQAPSGFKGVTDEWGWGEFAPTYAFQVDRGDEITGKSSLEVTDFVSDDDNNYLGYVSTQLETKEGTYTINPGTGQVSFLPNDKFFTEAELNDKSLTEKKASPIRVVVSNMTTHRFDGDNHAMSFSFSRPAHTIADDNESYKEVSTLYTPTVMKPHVVIRDAEAMGDVGTTVTVSPNYAQETGQAAIDPSKVTLRIPDGLNASLSDDQRTLTVPGEGVWKVNATNGSIAFTPEATFVGQPTQIWYASKTFRGVPTQLVDDGYTSIKDGHPTLKVTYTTTDGRFARTFGLQGKEQTSTEKAAQTGEKGDQGLTAKEMFPGYPNDWYSQFTYQLVDPQGNLVEKGQPLTIEGQGAFTIDEKTGVVSFTPAEGFTGAGPVVGVRITNFKTANDHKRGEDGRYQPVVSPTGVILENGYNTGEVGTTIDVKPNYQPEGLPDIDPATVQLLKPSAPKGGWPAGTEPTLSADGKEFVVPGQGTWTVKDDGTVSFTPEKGFLGNPTPVKYTAKSKAMGDAPALQAQQPGELVALYPRIQPRKAITYGSPSETQHSNDKSSPGDAGLDATELFPGLPNEWIGDPVQFKLVDADGTLVDSRTIDGVGTYTIDPKTGVVAFKPVEGFLGEGETMKEAATVKIQAINTTARGTSVNSPLVAEYLPIVEKRDETLPTLTKLAPELGKPVSGTPDYVKYQTKPETVKIVGADEGTNGKTKSVPGQGTWTVDPTTGEFTFTPEPGFVGNPTPVEYTAEGPSGPAKGTGSVTFVYPSATTVPASTGGPQGTEQKSTDTQDSYDRGATTAQMFPNLPEEWYGKADSPVKFELVTPDGKTAEKNADGKYEWVKDGVGTYTLDPATGEVTFQADKAFTGEAPTVTIRTVGLKDENGKPKEMESTYSPFVFPVALELPSGHASSDSNGAPLNITPTYKDDIDKASITFVKPEGATLSEDGKTLTVPKEGTWTVDENGKFTFTPQGLDAEGGAFLGSPTPVMYTAKNTQGIPATVPGQVTAFYSTPDPHDAVTIDNQGVEQHSTDTTKQGFGNDEGLTAAQMFTVMQHATWWKDATFTLLDADGKETNTVTYDGQGTYTIDPKTGVVTFKPEPNFSGKANAVSVSIKDIQSVQGLRATAKYTAVVVGNVTLPDAKETGVAPGQPATVTSKYPSDVDKASITIVKPEGGTLSEDGKTLTVPNQGTWTVDDKGVFTFTPADGFTGNPDPIQYTAKTTSGVDVKGPGTISAEYAKLPLLPDAKETGVTPGKPGTVTPKYPTDVDKASITIVKPEGGTLSEDGKTLTVPGQGVWTVDEKGVFTFKPADGFTGNPDPIKYTAKTTSGAEIKDTGTISVDYVKTPPPAPETVVALPSAFERATEVGKPVDVTPTYTEDINKGSITIVGADGDGKKLVVDGEGTWTVDENGKFTFTPDADFKGTPTPIGYLASNKDGVKATVPGQIVALYPCNCAPAPSEPGPSEPGPSEPGPSEPGPSNPDPSKPNPSKPDPSKPNPSKPDPSKPNPSKPDPSSPDPSKPDPSSPNPSNPTDQPKPPRPGLPGGDNGTTTPPTKPGVRPGDVGLPRTGADADGPAGGLLAALLAGLAAATAALRRFAR